MNFETLFVNPNGRTSRADFVPALLTVLAAIGFFAYFVPGRTGQFCMLVLMYPLFVLLTRRVRDMGCSAWLVLVPLLPVLACFAIKLEYLSLGDAIDGVLRWIALALSAAFLLWASTRDRK